jgi:heme/copper-type cytochrome/quinol oxidase subunit 4
MAVLAEHNPEDAYQNDYHGHPNYVMIWGILVVALIISIIPGQIIASIKPTGWVLAGIFIVSTIKALIVLGNFMHIKYEPKLLWGLMGFALFVFAAFFWGVLPDVNHNFDRGVNEKYGIGEYNTYTVKGNDDGYKMNRDSIKIRGEQLKALLHSDSMKKTLHETFAAAAKEGDEPGSVRLDVDKIKEIADKELAAHGHGGHSSDTHSKPAGDAPHAEAKPAEVAKPAEAKEEKAHQ